MFVLRGWRKIFLITVLIAAGVFGLARLYYQLTDDIRLANMMYSMPHHQEWEIPPLSPEEKHTLNTILSQPYHYIGKGAQSYAFASEDGQYVLKFFKFKHLKPSWFVEMLPSIFPFKDYKEKQKARKERQLEGVFAGYRLAYNVHKEPSGIIYIHLNPSNDLHQTVLLKDKIGLTHTVDLDQFVFILQQKARTTRNVVKDLLKEGNTEGVKQKIDSIINLYLSEYAKGIYDRDHGVMHNTGFVGNTPIHLDVGKLTAEPLMKQAEFANPDLIKIAAKFHSWIHTNYPQYAHEIDTYMEKRLSDIQGKSWTFEQVNDTQK